MKLITATAQTRVMKENARLLIIAVLVFFLPSIAAAQNGTSATDSFRPAGMQTGAPDSAYAQSGFDNVNLFSGNLNFSLPLLNIKGRGPASAAMVLRIDSIQWRVIREVEASNGFVFYYAEPNLAEGRRPGYGPGIVQIRRSGTSGIQTPQVYGTSITRMSFTAPDGTEYELRDNLRKGEPFRWATSGATSPISRGKVFESADGSAMTFISDVELFESRFVAQHSGVDYPSGYLLFADGTKYRVVSGLVRWIRDKNGNQINFQYELIGQNETDRVVKITDSLNREITITYANMTTVMFDEIKYNGMGGATNQRSIKIFYSLLANSLIAGQTIQNRAELFPELMDATFNPPDYNPHVVSRVDMENGKFYELKYNKYGELSSVVLPTGGKVTYGYYPDAPGSGVVGSDSAEGFQIHRRIKERATYLNSTDTIPQQKTAYILSPTPPAGSTEVTVEQRSGAGTLMGKVRHRMYGSPTESLYTWPSRYYPSWKLGREYETAAMNTSGAATTVMRVEAQTWDQSDPPWWGDSPSETHQEAPPLNTRLQETTSTWVDTNQVSKRKYTYDQFNNYTSYEEFDYGTNAAPTHPTRKVEIDYVVTGETNQLNYTSFNVNAPQNSIHIRRLPKEQRVYAVNTQTGALITPPASTTHFHYDQFALTDRQDLIQYASPATAGRGNLTSSTRTVNAGTTVTNSMHYDIAGNIVQSIDPLGRVTEYDYLSDGNAYAYPSAIRTPVPDALGERGSNARLETSYTYDFWTGKLLTTTDPNDNTVTYHYNDPLHRITSIVRPAGAGQTTYTYSDTVGNIFVKVETSQTASQTLEATRFYDGLGRVTKTSKLEGATSVFVEKRYDACGRVEQTSNPYRTNETPSHWTTYEYDPLGRVKKVTAPGGAIMTYAYSGNSATTTDADSKTKKTVSDALGRISLIIEDPGASPRLNYETSYTYDALDNPRRIVQGGQTRYNAFDSLGRLIRVKAPEHNVNTSLAPYTDPVTGNTQWSMAFSYDAVSNLVSKTDPRNITSSYTYDALNRVLTKSYLNDPSQTPTVDYKYDGVGMTAANALGKLTRENSSVSLSTYDDFDDAGRLLHSTQTTDNVAYSISYEYDLMGNLTRQTYPSGKVFETEYNAAGQITRVSSGSTDYVSDVSYTPHGVAKELKLGNGLWEHTSFNERLQPTEIGLGTTAQGTDKLKLNYTYGTTINNGNVRTHTITIPGGPALVQSFTYDPLNRLEIAQENNGSSWKQKFTYDRFGNRSVDVANTSPGMVGPNPQISIDTNRIVPRPGEQYEYDAMGNLKKDAAGNTFTYDAEGRIASSNTGGQQVQYKYDGSGHRVKVIASAATVFVYDASGKLIAEYAGAPQSSPSTSYLTNDVSGTPRIITGGGGTVKARHDYLPFGEEITANTGGRTAAQKYVQDNVRQKFTGKERDAETGLDYFYSRYYSSAQGRFMSPDSVAGSRSSPQTLNLYAYVLNNPLRYTDPTGHSARANDSYHGDFGPTGSAASESRYEEYLANTLAELAEKEAEPEPQESPMGEGYVAIEAAAQNGGLVVFVQAGILNDKLSDTREARQAVAENLAIDIKQVVVVPNDHNGIAGLTGDANKKSAYYMESLIKQALSKLKDAHGNPDPSRIILVAHSNGNPTLHHALSRVSTSSGFGAIFLFAPNTKDMRVLKDIASRSNTVTIFSSISDLSLLPTSQRSFASIISRAIPHAEVYSTTNIAHGIKDYIQAYKSKPLIRLNKGWPVGHQ